MNPQTTPAPAAPDPDLVRFYEEDARRYALSLWQEDYMESTQQATQREITLESFALIRAARPDVQCFNELLIQYPIPGQKQPGRVVPDNFVVIHPEPLGRMMSFAVATAPARPVLVLEYVSKDNYRKDYEDNLVRYEQSLRIPYYLAFYPDNEELSLFRLVGGKYEATHANDSGRLAVPELELEAAILDGWVRFWFRGELLSLPAELNAQLAAARRERDAERAARQAAERERDSERAARLAVEAELTRLREELARAKGTS
jgi:Uma2 family endonuclease